MTKIAYLQCPTGIAGDMCLGALIDAGVPLEYLQSKLQNLGIAEEFSLRSEVVQRRGQRATKVHVDIFSTHTSHVENHTTPEHHHHHQGRHLPEIEQLINHGQLPERSQQWSLQVFRQLAQVEGAVHGMAPEQVHFHEVGAVDAIVDIVGTCLGLDWLGIEGLYCSPLPTGGGTVKAAHGILAVPVPAVLQLWQTRQVPVYSNGIEMELVTPTGAALAVTLANNFGNPPAMTIEKVGLGAGSKDLTIPNILQLWIGEDMGNQGESPYQSSAKEKLDAPLETVAVLETQIDDLSPQAIGYIYEILFQAGALDVFTQAVGMKKSRPGILLTVICPPSQIDACERVIFQETTTLGIRQQLQQRRILEREIQQVETAYGNVRVKIGRQGNKIINVQPEYEDCAQLAKQQKQSWLVIQQMALCAWYSATR